MQTNSQKILDLLQDGQWHESHQLNSVAGWDWRKGLSVLRLKYGYEIENVKYGRFKQYRLKRDNQPPRAEKPLQSHLNASSRPNWDTLQAKIKETKQQSFLNQ